ncbi:MAG: phytase [Acidobacteriota bacterium]
MNEETRKKIAGVISIYSILMTLSLLTVARPTAAGPVVVRNGNRAPRSTVRPVHSVAATVETHPVPNAEDAADDSAIWIDPTDASRSAIIGTDKQGGIAVYDLAGNQIQYLPDGKMNNVDLRAGFPLSGESVALVAASNRSDDTIALYRMNPSTRMLEDVAARRVNTVMAYGCCMYRSAKTGKFYYFVNDKFGRVEQWELFDNGKGKVDARRVRTLKLATQVEGCVADDDLGYFYIGEENVGIWKYRAEPNGGRRRTLVDRTGPRGHLAADVEGLTIAYGKNGKGYLIASSQGDNSYVIYRREGRNRYVKTFRIIADSGIDEVSNTDGIDVTTANLGPAFPRGVFIAQDGLNEGHNQNFKLVPLHLITGEDQP